MKKKTIFFIIAIVVIVIGLLAWGVISFAGELGQKTILREEVAKITSMDITSDNIDMNIRTKNDYAVVEQTIKDFFNEYAKTLQETLGVIQDEKLGYLLSADNYKEDGPEFAESLEYIKNTKNVLAVNFAKLEGLSTKENIEKRIEGKELSEKYISLYNELMIADSTNEEFETAIQDLNNAKKEIDNLLNIGEKVLNFLAENKGNWEVDSESRIIFKTDKLAEEYNTLISPLLNE